MIVLVTAGNEGLIAILVILLALLLEFQLSADVKHAMSLLDEDISYTSRIKVIGIISFNFKLESFLTAALGFI